MAIHKNKINKQAHYKGLEIEQVISFGELIGFNQWLLMENFEFPYKFKGFIPLSQASNDIKALNFKQL